MIKVDHGNISMTGNYPTLMAECTAMLCGIYESLLIGSMGFSEEKAQEILQDSLEKAIEHHSRKNSDAKEEKEKLEINIGGFKLGSVDDFIGAILKVMGNEE